MTFQAKLTTRLEKFSINDTIVELRNDVDKEQLNHVVKNILRQIKEEVIPDLDDTNFEFLVGGKFLQLSIEKHLELYSDEIDAKEILSEKLVEIEYVLSLDPPKPLEAIPHEDWVSCVDANESYIISGSYDNSIKIFSIKNRKILVNIQNAHEKPVTKVRWVQPSRVKNKNELYFVSCGHDEVSILRRLNPNSLKTSTISIFKGHNRSVNCLDCFDDLLVTGSFDKSLRLWSIAEPTSVDEEHETDGSGVSASTKKRQKVSDKSTSSMTRNATLTLTGHQESITGVRWLKNCNEYNSVATCSQDRSICIWDVEVGECKRRMLSAKPLLSLDFSSDHNLIITASCDRHVRIWDSRAPDSATAKSAFTSHNAWVSSVAFGEGSNNFISGGYDNLVKIWDLRSSKACLYDMIGHHDKVLDVNWKNKGYVLSGSADATLKIFAT